jgi:FkbM family methyltransferase
MMRWYLRREGCSIVETKQWDENRRRLEDYHRGQQELLQSGNLNTFWAAMERLLKRNIAFNTVIDIGASDGRFTLDMLRYFPNANYLCVDAEAQHEPALRELARSRSNVQYLISAAGDREGEIFFQSGKFDSFGGRAAVADGQNAIGVPMTTIDQMVKSRGLKGPFFLKLDTHGFEMLILEGAKETLKETNVFLSEVYNVQIGGNSPLFYEFCAAMEKRGFQCADIIEPLYRPSDQMLWQMDFIFLPKTRPEFSNPGFP